MRTKFWSKVFGRTDSPSDLDRKAEEMRQAWRGRRLRALQRPLAVTSSDLMGLPEFEARGISVVPSQFQDTLFYPLDGLCQ